MSGQVRTPVSLFVSGYAWANRAAIPSISVWACSIVTYGLSRAIAEYPQPWPRFRSGSMRSGTSNSTRYQQAFQIEFWRQDTDDRVRVVVQHDGPAEDVRVGGELTPPESVGEQGDAFAGGSAFRFGGQSAKPRIQSQERQQVGGGLQGANLLGLALSGDRQAGAAVHADVRE